MKISAMLPRGLRQRLYDIREPLFDRLAAYFARGKTIIPWKPEFNYDGLATSHSASFMASPKFKNALAAATEGLHQQQGNVEHFWRMYVCCWAGHQAARLEGDFVEFGANWGIGARAVMEYAGVSQFDRRVFWLLDAWEGRYVGLSEAERRDMGGRQDTDPSYCADSTIVERNFAQFPFAKIVKGRVPEVLDQIRAAKVAYVHMDMGSVAAEIPAIEFIWPKLVPGCVVVFNNYGVSGKMRKTLQEQLDSFADRHGARILGLPTGQGLLIKSL
jgi:O-methyltransferase